MSNLHKARKAKNDEFYTQYIDIEKECQHYIEQFKDQWIYLPCDTEESNFWKYFVDHFIEYRLKRLTATHINIDGTPSYRLDYDGLMAVPITVMFYNPKQFDIIGCANANALPNGWSGMTKEFIDLYYSQSGTGQYQVGNRLEFYITKDGKAKAPYKRILIKLKKDE